MLERSASPMKRFYQNRFSDESKEEEQVSEDDEEINAEEVVEIDCGAIGSDK